MPKLIDSEKLKAHYAWWDNKEKDTFDTIVDLQPEAVVRCKNCKNYWESAGICTIASLPVADSVRDNDFCSRGERKEDAEID